MKVLKTRSGALHRSAQHWHNIAEIGNSKQCPLNAEESSLVPAADVATWLRLQAFRLDYRLLYSDMAVCLAFILFLLSALCINKVFDTQPVLTAMVIVVLLMSSVLFIGIHLLGERKLSKKQQTALLLSNVWMHYCTSLKRGRLILRLYFAALVILSVMFWYQQGNPSSMYVIWLAIFSGGLFAYGIYFLAQIMRLKIYTRYYCRCASQLTHSINKSQL